MSLEQAKAQKKILKKIPVFEPHGIIDVAPRVGKTKLTIDILKRYLPKSVLWVTPFTDLKTSIIEEFKLWEAEELLEVTIITSYKSLPKILGFYQTIILDEYQFITVSNCKNILSKELEYHNILCLSGTKTESSEKHKILKQLNLKTLFSYSLVKAVKEKVLSDFTLNVVQIYAKPEQIKEYNKWQGIISKHNVGTYDVGPEGLTTFGAFEMKLKLVEKQSQDSTSRVFSLRTELNRSTGYIVRFEDTSHQGKLTIGEDVYILKNRVISKPVNFFLYVQRAKSIGESQAKTQYCRELLLQLKNEKNILFCQSIKQSEELSENTFNGKTDSIMLDKFQNNEIKTLALVNKGGVGTTYRGLDNLILMQVDRDANGRTSQKLSRSLVKQAQYTANLWILCLMGTPDEDWVENIVNKLKRKIVNYVEHRF